jgi:hypothetical protein
MPPRLNSTPPIDTSVRMGSHTRTAAAIRSQTKYEANVDDRAERRPEH